MNLPTLSRKLFIVLSASAALAGWGLRADTVDDAVRAEMDRQHIPGVSIAVIEGGKIVRASGYGVKNLETAEPVSAETLFQAGSVSKAVAATAALTLAAEGKFPLDADINTVLKTWHLPENEFTAQRKVTLRFLLSHSAGTTIHGFAGYAHDEIVPTLVEVLDGGKPANSSPIRVNVVPGTTGRYSGGGYLIIQQAIIDLTGEAFPAVMRKRVLEPLGMTGSTYEQPLPRELHSAAASGYLAADKPLPGSWHVYPEMSAAGLWTTPSDLARFAIGIQRAIAKEPNAILPAGIIDEMITPQMQSFGLGLSLSGVGNLQKFGHNGRNHGFDTSLTAFSHRGQGAVVMMNMNDNSGAIGRILHAISVAYQWPSEPPRKLGPAIDDAEPEITQKLKTIMFEAQQGRFDPELYTPKLAAVLTTELASDGRSRAELVQLGALKHMEPVARGTKNGSRVYRYRCVYENGTVELVGVFDPSGHISGLVFRPE